ncbi:MAG: endonuclease/exonuclease/phosphatase family protein [Deltaproteobacteria bacterium]|nr:endonuclease/exonuclease/phosphatase family protein [Deltaproteobacteria bacterium]
MARRALWIGAGLLGLAGLLTAGRGALWLPAAVETARVEGLPARTPLRRGEPLSLLFWNVQYAGSRGLHFFYDGGEAVRVPAAVVEATLAGQRALIQADAPDLLLLAEADRGSDRTGRVDEFAALTGGWPQRTSAPYHRAIYVPHPSHQPMGRVEMHLGLASRLPLRAATRHQLALLDESPLRRLFNLRRALLDTRLPLEGGGELAVLVTHLSAFSRGDGTLGAQIEQLAAHLARLDAEGTQWVLLGDLNALPPGDAPDRLGEAAALYPEGGSPLTPLYRRWRGVPPLEQALDPAWRTYLPFGSDTPDRTLDYGFVSDGIVLIDARTVPVGGAWSDHLPLRVELAVR